MKIKILTAVLFSLLFISPVVFAEKSDTVKNTIIKQERENLKLRLQTQKEDILQNIQRKKIMFQQETKTVLRNINNLGKENRQKAKEELQAKRETLLNETTALRQNLKEGAKDMRDNFKEKVKSPKQRALIASAHGKGLRMINRYRSAVARFDNILQRLETRVEKMENNGVDVSSIVPLIEEAKNMGVQNKAKLEELKAKYESLLSGENTQGAGKEAGQIAKELKSEIIKLHAKLKEIISAIKVLAPEEVRAQ